MGKGESTLYGYTVEIRDTEFHIHDILRLPDGTIIGSEWQSIDFHKTTNLAGIPSFDEFDDLGVLSRGFVPYLSAVALSTTILAMLKHNSFRVILRIVEYRQEYTFETIRTGIVGKEITSTRRHDLVITAEESE